MLDYFLKIFLNEQFALDRQAVSVESGEKAPVKIELPLVHDFSEQLHTVVSPQNADAEKSRTFWRGLYPSVSEKDFLDERWQYQNSVKNIQELRAVLSRVARPECIDDIAVRFAQSKMPMRITPYVLSLIDWEDPYSDPVRKQFLPAASTMQPDHPCMDSVFFDEAGDSPVPGLVHLYPTKALFKALDTCPVYCPNCFRYPLTGKDAEAGINHDIWKQSLQYIAAHPKIEDVTVSGGDVYQLRPDSLRFIVTQLLNMQNVKRVRLGSKGLAVMPQKILSDSSPWLDALTEVSDYGRTLEKEVALHTHINHPKEITWMTTQAASKLYKRNIICRNQSVLIRGVNDTMESMEALIKKLADAHIQPYYVYLSDIVPGAEDFRTTLQTAVDLEKNIRGITAGFLTPHFVVATAGGKRPVNSFETYDRNGVAVFKSPYVKPGQSFLHFDPIALLPADVQVRWENPGERQAMLTEARSSTHSL